MSAEKQKKIEKILVELGYDLVDKGRFWQTNALYRNGDNRTAIQIWKDTGIWKDFVQNTRYLPFKKLIELSTHYGYDKIDSLLEGLNNNDTFNFERPKCNKMPIDQFFDHQEVKTLLPHYAFYNKKGISDDTLKKYNCGFSMSGKMNGRFVFPIYDQNGKVIGVSGRHLLWKEGCNYPKWKHLGRKANWIFPAYNKCEDFRKSLSTAKEVVIVEGIGDSLALTEQGTLNHFVAFGLEISSKQMSWLSSLNAQKIIIATNNDKNKEKNRGLDAAIKIFLKLIEVFDIDKVDVKLPCAKDFGEMLENGQDIGEWTGKKVDKLAQVQFILKRVSSCDEYKNQTRAIKLLKNYIQQHNAQGNTLCE